MSTSTPGRAASYLPNVQIMRFVAALMVLLGHLMHETVDHRVPFMAPLLDKSGIEWGSGVDIFFVISGFVMYYLSHERFGQRGYPAEFLSRRLVRVVPLYWIFTSLMLLAVWLLPAVIRHAGAARSFVVSSYLFYPVARADGLVRPTLALGWTLEYEMFFYACFALALLGRRSVGVLGLVGGFLLLVIAGPALPREATPLVFWSNPVILEFLLGMLVAQLYLKGLRLSARLQWLLIAAAILLMLLATPLKWERLFWAGVPACLLVAGAVLGPCWKSRWLELGGDSSYSLYLSHPFTLNLLALLWTWGHLPPSGAAYVLSGMIACVLVGVAIHRLIEAPLLGQFRRPRAIPIRSGSEAFLHAPAGAGYMAPIARERVAGPHELETREG
ncbi:MAG TPA: acyltransferase [Steroidobacteraceae bacterium]